MSMPRATTCGFGARAGANASLPGGDATQHSGDYAANSSCGVSPLCDGAALVMPGKTLSGKLAPCSMPFVTAATIASDAG